MLNNYTPEPDDYAAPLIFILLIVLMIIAMLTSKAEGAEIDYTLDQWADAIYTAEGKDAATYLYGIRSITYDTPEQARRYCKNTVRNTLIKYRESRCAKGESDIDCLSRRYCPLNSDTDNGTCQYWKGNVMSALRIKQ